MIVSNKQEYDEVIEKLLQEDYVAIDTETEEFTKQKTHAFQLALDGIGVYAKGVKAFIPKRFIESSFQRVLDKAICIMHNAKFDLTVLRNEGFNIDAMKFEDTMLMSWLLNENRFSHGLKELAKSVLRVKEERVVKFGDVTKRPVLETYGMFPEDFPADYAAWETQLGEYCIDDCKYAYKLFFEFEERLKEQEIWPVYQRVELPFVRVLIDIESTGISVDTEYLNNIGKQIQLDLVQLQTTIWKEAGKQFDINSPKQLSKILFEDRKYTVTDEFKTPKGDNSTNVQALVYLTEQHPEDKLLKALMEYRNLFKLKGSFIEGLLEKQIDSVIFASFNHIGTVTGRLSSSNPNCISTDSEVLTKNGWKNVLLVEEGEKIASWENGKITFSSILSIYKGKAKCLHIKNQHIDAVLTKNHRCLFQDRKDGTYKIRTADKYLKDSKLLHGGLFSGNEKASVYQLKYAVAVQADGEIRPDCSDTVVFRFAKERKARRLTVILEILGLTYVYKKTKNGQFSFIVKGSRFVYSQYLDADKTFSWGLLNLESGLKRDVIEELFYWDGLYTRKTEYVSKHEKNIDVMQALCSLVGYRGKKVSCIVEGKTYWRMYLVRRNYSLTANTKIIELDKEQDVWCCRVKSGFFLARRNNNPFITGNCQQLPRRGDKYNIRKAFIPRKGHCFVISDLSQVELRMATHFSQDPTMLKAYQEGKDIHQETADALGLVGKEGRNISKSVNFGLLYGRTAYGMAKGLNMDPEEAEKFIKKYFSRFKNIEILIEQCKNTIRNKYAIQTMFKRKRRFPEYAAARKARDHKAVSRIERMAVSALIQGSAADLLKMQMINIHQKLKPYKASILISVHDELIVETPLEHSQEVLKLVKYEMENAVKLKNVPMVAEAFISDVWAKG